ncbi:flagellar type III secretion system pore protein FliP [Alphaproteobacteria bacterium]|jgi:flagellar biosynthetic protein FliP|nr:flagellar type III secretion system pore protein FliP [Alphaproteobacteria bacterium]
MTRQSVYHFTGSFLIFALIFGLASGFVSGAALAQGIGGGIPAFNVANAANGDSTYSLSLQILALMTGLTLLPSLVLGMTSFTRIIIVLSILRQAMGTQQTPPNQVLVAIALFLTLFIMAPTFTEMNTEVISPYLDGVMPADLALVNGANVMKDFLINNTRVNDLVMFTEMAGDQPYASPEDVPLTVLLPAFITSELKTAFQIGFLLFLPFLVIDMVIASILMSLGMMMLSPMLVSLPFKLLLFVLVDGWAMTVGSLVATYASG